jgi:hypothetical protein
VAIFENNEIIGFEEILRDMILKKQLDSEIKDLKHAYK